MRLLLVLVAMAGLAACDVAQEAADDVARGQAKRATADVLAREFPGIDATPFTDCVIDNASAQEILQIAGASATGAQAEVTQNVLRIMRRPGTLSCFAGHGLTLTKG